MTKSVIKFEYDGNNTNRVELYLRDEKPKVLGHYNTIKKTFYTLKKKKHVLSFLNAFGFNKHFIDSYPIQHIEVCYGKKILRTTKTKLISKGKVHCFEDYDEQYFLPITEFTEVNNPTNDNSKHFLKKRKLYY
jgi:hypothetical protein